MSGFLLRWLVAFAALAALYNPTDYNYYTWVQANYEAQQPLAIGIGVMLGLIFLIYLITMLRTLRVIGIVLLAIIIGLLGYILLEKGMITLDATDTNVWGLLVLASLLLGGAMSWRVPSKKKSRKTKTAKA
ncbi:hypothetical protein RGUI_1224 [Rhodovulum sp. P5]|uniref:DUF6524 family protein n=1 Tax=Rhodovulum sp. P5 TaxID=1564506 RepID=UPI0009C373EB|nr:DUF6524 family protein [Rhodovulum sp. P5]ARE39365.1 hypothetical protein RGUI_1224 [Rhodovulum sp. P5]